LLFAQGIRVGKITSSTLAIEKLVTGDGHRLPPRLAAEITREMQRLATVEQQIDVVALPGASVRSSRLCRGADGRRIKSFRGAKPKFLTYSAQH
jgi:hypothetical protein